MKIILHPQYCDDTLTASVSGDTITLNGQVFDFGPLPDGAALPRTAVACGWIAGDVHRVDGVLHIPLLLPHGADASEAARFPAPIINPPDGTLDLPK